MLTLSSSSTTTATAGIVAPIINSGASDTNTTAGTTQAKSWRDVLPIHPAADKIPQASDSERRGLAGDVARHGQKVPVVLVRVAGGPLQLLDGRHRLDFLEGAGTKVVGDDGGVLVQYQIVDVADDAEAERLSLSLNAHRRHLPADKRREILRAQLAATPEKSDVAIGEIVGFSDKTVTKVRRDLEATSEIPRLEKTVGKDGKTRKKPATAKKARSKTEPAAEDIAAANSRITANIAATKTAPAKMGRRTEDDFKRDLAAKKAAVSAPASAETTREVVADDEKLALLSEFAQFVISRAKSVSVDPRDNAEWTSLRGRVKQVLGGGQ